MERKQSFQPLKAAEDMREKAMRRLKISKVELY